MQIRVYFLVRLPKLGRENFSDQFSRLIHFTLFIVEVSKGLFSLDVLLGWLMHLNARAYQFDKSQLKAKRYRE